MLAHVSLLFLWLSVVLVFSVQSQEVEPLLCKIRCICLDKVVDCNQLDYQVAIPTNVPSQYQRLFVQYATFLRPRVSRHNFTHLEHLQHLKVIYTNLNHMQSNTFINMSALRELDLSHNELSRLEPYTFQGLRLNTLYLENNYHLDLSAPHVFGGLVVKRLSLKNTNVKILHFATFSHLQLLEELNLFNNSLTTLDPQFGTLFNKKHQTLDLTANPLQCNCDLLWLWKFFRLQRPDPFAGALIPSSPGSTSKSHHNSTCTPPYSNNRAFQKLAVRPLEELTATELGCSAATITNIQVDVDHTTLLATLASTSPGHPVVEVVCRTRGDPPPKVSFHYLESLAYLVNSVRNDIVEEELETGKPENRRSARVNISMVQNTTPPVQLTLKCVAENEIQGPSELNFTLSMTDYLSGLLTNEGIVSKPEGSSTRTSLFSRKQFDLIELMGAIIGTLLSTAVLFCLGLYFFYRRPYGQRHKKYPSSTSCCSQAAPLSWTSNHHSNSPPYPPTVPSPSTAAFQAAQYPHHHHHNNNNLPKRMMRLPPDPASGRESDLETALLGPVYDVPMLMSQHHSGHATRGPYFPPLPATPSHDSGLFSHGYYPSAESERNYLLQTGTTTTTPSGHSPSSPPETQPRSGPAAIVAGERSDEGDDEGPERRNTAENVFRSPLLISSPLHLPGPPSTPPPPAGPSGRALFFPPPPPHSMEPSPTPSPPYHLHSSPSPRHL